ncbi:MAG: hypothetical protein C0603_10525 [Denitrovibrio sp.]|nr:MAG: hypothetical protein C0603_10525 [Denitrovibrio sp.]
MEESTKVSLQCFFCFSDQFVLPDEGKAILSGDLVECANCGRLNDYDSLMRVAKRKGIEWVEEQVQEMVDDFTKQLKNVFK